VYDSDVEDEDENEDRDNLCLSNCALCHVALMEHAEKQISSDWFSPEKETGLPQHVNLVHSSHNTLHTSPQLRHYVEMGGNLPYVTHSVQLPVPTACLVIYTLQQTRSIMFSNVKFEVS
jgi:hypothetical protein